MKYLKTYESFEESEFILDLKDLLIDLEDLDFNIQYGFDKNDAQFNKNLPYSSETIPAINIIIRKNNENSFFYVDENIE
jgi:hypothetical protein